VADSDLAITASQVIAGRDAEYFQGTAGATLVAGQAVYLENLSQQLKLSASDAGSAVKAVVKGITLHGASDGQPCRIITSGTLDVGAAAAPAVGMEYVASDTPGGICERDEIQVGWYTTIIGVGGENHTLLLSIFPSGQVYAG
jgi:hypothetical protein